MHGEQAHGDRVHHGDLGHRAAPERHHALALPLAEVAAEQLVQLGRVGLEPRVGFGLALARSGAAQQRADACARIGLEVRRVLGLAALEQVVLEVGALLHLVERLDQNDLIGRQPVEDSDHFRGVDLAGGGVEAVRIHGPAVGHLGLVDRPLQVVGDGVRVELPRGHARQPAGHGLVAAVERVDRLRVAARRPGESTDGGRVAGAALQAQDGVGAQKRGGRPVRLAGGRRRCDSRLLRVLHVTLSLPFRRGSDNRGATLAFRAAGP